MDQVCELCGAVVEAEEHLTILFTRENLEVLDLLMVAQGEHKCLGIALTVPQQEKPIYLALLYDHFMGFFSHYTTMKPRLCSVDDCAQRGWVQGAGTAQNIQTRTSFPPGVSLLQGSTLGLDWVVDDAAGASRKIHSDQGVLRHTPHRR